MGVVDRGRSGEGNEVWGGGRLVEMFMEGVGGDAEGETEKGVVGSRTEENIYREVEREREEVGR